jgi:hypothetical protein
MNGRQTNVLEGGGLPFRPHFFLLTSAIEVRFGPQFV